jgi:DNA adenine methylase
VFCEYGPKTFSKKDLNRLREHLERIDKLGADFLLSYADCGDARTLFKKWQQKRIKVRRNIAGFSSYRRHAYELLITNTHK